MKIDFVVPWVDGSDSEWLAERQKYSNKIIQNDYRDWGLFKYWFRSIEKYAPWVNKVYFITYGHLPTWLNINHPKLVIVNHKDYIPEEYLPTFSANCIELNLHRIQGLSEHFVYFNDDTYLCNMTKPRDFFVDGLPTDTAIINPVAPARYDTICNMMVNNIGIINDNFNKKKVMLRDFWKWFNVKYGKLNLLNLIFLPWGNWPGLLQQHLPSSLLKSSYEELWNEHYDILNNASLNHVRNFKVDVNQWLIKEWQIAKGNFSPTNIKRGKYFLVKNYCDAENVVKYMNKNKPKMVCVNDHVEGLEIEKIIEYLQSEFDKKFPSKSKFEV